MVQLEDFIYLVLSKFSSAIRDSIISKFLVFGFALSIVTNVYFLNAARYQVSATHKLIEKEISVLRIVVSPPLLPLLQPVLPLLVLPLPKLLAITKG